jgi:membrane associated rhomboid family serine protease
MASVSLAGNDAPNDAALDVCTRCHFIWFDPREFEGAPHLPPPQPTQEPEIPERGREIWARLQAQAIAERANREYGAEPPDHWWEWALGIFGLPIEDNSVRLKEQPWGTWGLAASIVIVSLLAFSDLQGIVNEIGLIPAKAFRYGGLTFVTAFFLHAGLIHLLGNMYFLLIFGDNVEDYLGGGRFALLVIVATIAGGVLHVLLDPRPEIPVIGASGGISGLIAFYALAFPRARLGFLWRFYFYVRWLRVPAYFYVGLWVLAQLFLAVLQIEGRTSVSALGHLGGAAAGVAFWLKWGRVKKPAAPRAIRV